MSAPLVVLAGRYELRRRIARGGMAEVFEGFDRRLARVVAVKVLQDEGDPTFAERLRREAEAAARVSSPHIVNVYDVGEDDGRPFLVMELVEGKSLAEVIRQGPLPVERAVAIANSVLDALDAAHSLGVVHRDVKPGNILLANSGAVKLSDFGIAMVTSDMRNRLTATNIVMGSPSYLAPERGRGEPGSPRSDLYAVGVVLYEMLTGRTPFAADNAAQLAMAHQKEIPVLVNEVRPEVPAPLATVIAISMAKDPERRFRDANAMRTALARARSAHALSHPDDATVVIDADRTTAFAPARTVPQAAASASGAAARSAAGAKAPVEPPARSRRAPVFALAVLVTLVAIAVVAFAASRKDGDAGAPDTTAAPPASSATAPSVTAAPVATTVRSTTPVSTAPGTTVPSPQNSGANSSGPNTTRSTAPTSTTARSTSSTVTPSTVLPLTVAGLITEIGSGDPYRYGEAGVIGGHTETNISNADPTYNQNTFAIAYKPEAPTSALAFTVSSGNNSAQVTFTAPAGSTTAPTSNVSGATKLTYTATASPGGGTCSATTPTLQCTITGLTNNQAYVISGSYATAGGSQAAASTAGVTPSAVPGAPTGVAASIANDSTVVTWSAAPDNGSAITGYTATASPGGQSCSTGGLSCTITGLSNGTTYSVTVRATNNAGQGVASTAIDVKPGLGKYVALSNPSRFLDTRNGIGRSGTTKPAAGSSIDLQITGVAGIPADALAVVMNVTATGTTGAGYITAYPSGRGQPNASSVNIDSADETIANLVTVKIGNGGKVTLYTYEGAHLIADVAGYYVPAATSTSGRFTGLTPSRLLDTRSGSRPGKNSVTGVQVLGAGGVPSSGVSAVVLNLTGVNPTGPGYVTAYASGLAQPTASNINLDYVGQIIANQVIVPVGSDGRINLYTYDAVDLLVDVAGYYSDTTASSSGTGIFVAVNPSRILDTRPTRQAANTARQVQVAGNGGTPASGVGAAVFNLTAVDPLALGYVTAYPSGAVPTASNLNINYLGQIISNQTTVGLSNGAFNLYSYQSANLIVDLSGFFTA